MARVAQSIPLNIAEGNGKRSLKDGNRLLDVARGSARECAPIQDVLVATDGVDAGRNDERKVMLKRIVSMLTRLIARGDTLSDPAVEHEHEHAYEYRDAEYEYDGADEPEPTRCMRVGGTAGPDPMPNAPTPRSRTAGHAVKQDQ